MPWTFYEFSIAEWELVFKATNGAPFGAYDLYASENTRNENNDLAKGLNDTLLEHFKSMAINKWRNQYITKVKVITFKRI